jgi:hypothetical protein
MADADNVCDAWGGLHLTEDSEQSCATSAVIPDVHHIAKLEVLVGNIVVKFRYWVNESDRDRELGERE